MKRSRCAVAALLILSITACSDVGMSKTAQGGIAGAAIGSGLGAVVGDQVHHTGTGTAVGAGFGAVTGALIGAAMEERDDSRSYEEERLRRQEEEIRRQRREIDELRRERGSDYYRDSGSSTGDDYRYNDDRRY